jgi:hypothetical protein
MQDKGYFIKGSALLVHPFSPDVYVGGSVLVQGRSTSISAWSFGPLVNEGNYERI